MKTLEQLKDEGWKNCPACGYYYNHKILELCPACRHSHSVPVSYNQPAYESPTLD